MNVEQTINSLPPFARAEALDFLAFLKKKYGAKRSSGEEEGSAYWMTLGESSLRKVWDNEEDDVYNELLKR